jgi:hypothetical protein
MNKIRVTVLVFFLFISLLIPTLSNQSLLVQAEERDILVETDLRIELLTIVQYLSGNPILTRSEFPYHQEMIQKFLPFKSHFAVAFTKMLFERGFSYDAPPTAMLHLSQPPELKVVTPFTDYLIKRADGQQNMDKFVDGLRVFAKETNFISVMEEFKPYFKTIEIKTRQKFEGKKYLKQLEDYYGYGQHSYHIILGSFIHCGGYGPSIAREDGTADIYSIIGPCDVIEDYPDFGGASFFESLIFHEFSHSFINPLTESHLKEVNTCQKLFAPISQDMQRLAYGSWETCLNEHLGRIFTARISLVNKGEKTYVQELEDDIRLGFVYLPYLDILYQKYEQNRSQYPTIRDFYPEIILLIKNLTSYPSIPTKFAFSTTGVKGVGLEWKDNARDEDGFRIYRSIQKQSGYQILVELPKNSKEYDDNTIEPGGMYWYKLTAYNKNGEIEVSPIFTKIQFSVPNEPANFNLESVKGEIVTLGWEYKSKCSGFVLSELPDQKEIQRVQGDIREIILKDVSFGKHTYELRSYNQSGEEIKYCTKAPRVSAIVVRPPEDLKATLINDTVVELTWKLSENDSKQIAIFRRGGVSKEFNLLKEIPRAFRFVDENLEPDTEYEYQIHSKIDTKIESGFSKISSIKTNPKQVQEIIIKLKVGEQGVFIQEGRVFVPMGFIGERIGAKVSWDGPEQKITIQTLEVKLELWLGKNTAKVNGVERQIDPNNPKIMPVIRDGRSYLPLRFVGESLECEVKWDAKAQEVTLIYKRRV